MPVSVHASLFMHACFSIAPFAFFLFFFFFLTLFCSALCLTALAAVLSLFYLRLFSNLVHFTGHLLLCPTLEVPVQQCEPRARHAPFVFHPKCPCFGESDPLLAEMSAAIEISPIGRVIFLIGLACVSEGGLREHTGMSYVPSWHET